MNDWYDRLYFVLQSPIFLIFQIVKKSNIKKTSHVKYYFMLSSRPHIWHTRSAGILSLLHFNTKMWPTGRRGAVQQQEVKEQGRPSPGAVHRSVKTMVSTNWLCFCLHTFGLLLVWSYGDAAVLTLYTAWSWLQFTSWQSDCLVALGPVQETRAQGEEMTNCTKR